MKRYTMVGAAVSLALVGTTALAAPNIVNTSQKGSLLVFPEIDAHSDRNTIIRMANDATGAINVKCYYGEFTDQDAFDSTSSSGTVTPGNKPTRDFSFPMTRTQAVFWEVRDGDGTYQMPDFPSANTATGELVCWATNNAETKQVKWNHLSATATIIDPGDETSFSYNAWSFYARGIKNKEQVGAVAGRLDLNGIDKTNGAYDKCGRYIIGHFGPQNNEGQPVERVHVDDLYLSVASCTQDLVPVGNARVLPHWIVFTIWSEDETKTTGTKEKADGWWRMNLGACDIQDNQGNDLCDDTVDTGFSEIDVNPEHFTDDIQESQSAFFRAESFLDSAGTQAGYGLLGVMVHDLDDDDFSEEYDINATTTHHAGKRTGYILWQPDAEVPEKK